MSHPPKSRRGLFNGLKTRAARVALLGALVFGLAAGAASAGSPETSVTDRIERLRERFVEISSDGSPEVSAKDAAAWNNCWNNWNNWHNWHNWPNWCNY